MHAIPVFGRFQAIVIEDACRGIGLPTTAGRTTMDDARAHLFSLGVKFIDSDALLPV